MAEPAPNWRKPLASQKDAAQGTTAPGSGSRLVARLAASALLIGLAVATARETSAFIKSEKQAGEGIAKYRGSKNPNLGRVELRRAVATDPDNPDAILNLSNMIAKAETERAAKGQYGEVSQDSVQESVDLLAHAATICVTPSLAARQRGEMADFLSQLALRQKLVNDAKRHNHLAAESFATAIRLTPTLPNEDGTIFASALFTHWRDDQNARAAWYGREAMIRGGTAALDRRNLGEGYYAVLRSTGNFPAMMGELRREHWAKPGDLRILAQIERTARELGLEREAILLLEGTARQNALTQDGWALLERLRSSVPTAPPVGSTG
jgi:hypothetical protein